VDGGADPTQGHDGQGWDESSTRHLLDLIDRLAGATAEPDAVALLACATKSLGAQVGQFTSAIRDDDSLTSYRVLHVGNPAWATNYGVGEWWRHDSWLRYALSHGEPTSAAELTLQSEKEAEIAAEAAQAGFRHALVIPTPSTAAQSRVGVLCLGSMDETFLHTVRLPALRSFGRALAMELSDWTQRYLRADLMARAQISEVDLELLRHEQQGRSSKIIAAALGTEPKTIDGRFRRLSLRMGTANRRAATRLAELYGLI
jgi:DNA-binding NarL/FixJ family response regulator